MDNEQLVPTERKYKCPEHGWTSWTRCIICDAEFARERALVYKEWGIDITPEVVKRIVDEALGE
jgi:hypothetical protein